MLPSSNSLLKYITFNHPKPNEHFRQNRNQEPKFNSVTRPRINTTKISPSIYNKRQPLSPIIYHPNQKPKPMPPLPKIKQTSLKLTKNPSESKTNSTTAEHQIIKTNPTFINTQMHYISHLSQTGTKRTTQSIPHKISNPIKKIYFAKFTIKTIYSCQDN